MRLIPVSGIRGSGKTTLIRELIRVVLERSGARAAVIVNEEGATAYDEAFTAACRVPVAYLRGG